MPTVTWFAYDIYYDDYAQPVVSTADIRWFSDEHRDPARACQRAIKDVQPAPGRSFAVELDCAGYTARFELVQGVPEGCKKTRWCAMVDEVLVDVGRLANAWFATLQPARA